MAWTWLDHPYVLKAVDVLYATVPRRRPRPQALADTHIVSHRGIRDDIDVFENTFAAFDGLYERGIWGIECDIRYSADGVPMVFHDTDLLRLFGDHRRVADLSCEQLQADYPMIPTLEQLAQRYGGRHHLMLEFKAEPRRDPDEKLRRAQQALDSLAPRRDYHVMSLDIPTLDWLGDWTQECRVPIARGNIDEMSRYALDQDCSGISGHYVLLNAQRLRPHRAAGQNAGVGFPHSRNAMFHSIHCGARWIFTDQATDMQAALDAAKNASNS